MQQSSARPKVYSWCIGEAAGWQWVVVAWVNAVSAAMITSSSEHCSSIASRLHGSCTTSTTRGILAGALQSQHDMLGKSQPDFWWIHRCDCCWLKCSCTSVVHMCSLVLVAVTAATAAKCVLLVHMCKAWGFTAAACVLAGT